MKKYLMANRPDGLSDVIFEEEVPKDSVVDFWINFETPADMSSTADPTKGRTLLHEPPDGGAIFRVVRFGKDTQTVTVDAMLERHKVLNSVHVPSEEYLRSAKHPTMHRTDTLNYMILVSGRLWALTEGRDVLLQPGDVLVQQGCMHGWRTEGDEDAVLVAVLVDSKPL